MKLEYTFTKEPITNVAADIVMVRCRKDAKKKVATLLAADGGTLLDAALKGLISGIISEEEFSGEKGKCKAINTRGLLKAKNVLLIGTGEDSEFDLDAIRLAGSKASKIANELKAETIAGVVQPEGIFGMKAEARMQAFAEGMVYGGYRFDRYKTGKEKPKNTLKTVHLACKKDQQPIKNALERGSVIAEAICYAKDLVNTPGYDMTPEALAKEARTLCRDNGLRLTILDEKAIIKEKMRLITAVAMGASNPSRFIHIGYSPKKKARVRVAIVGKGITFDSGGYNLKTGKGIDHMKDDMAGAAAILAIVKLLPVIRPDAAVDAYIAAAENMIDGKAIKPGDVVTARNGKNIEILNTDAEGRLILADAFSYALEDKPDILIDIATLTGGVAYALGEIYTAILGNDQKLVDRLIGASKEGGEPTWQLPLEKEYLKGYKEGIADLNNTGKTLAGTISAALFLQEFVGGAKWAHLDIAESSFAKEERGYRAKGGTGAGVKTLVNFLCEF
jgi:leucyl aminopeptidase